MGAIGDAISSCVDKVKDAVDSVKESVSSRRADNDDSGSSSSSSRTGNIFSAGAQLVDSIFGSSSTSSSSSVSSDDKNDSLFSSIGSKFGSFTSKLSSSGSNSTSSVDSGVISSIASKISGVFSKDATSTSSVSDGLSKLGSVLKDLGVSKTNLNDGEIADFTNGVTGFLKDVLNVDDSKTVSFGGLTFKTNDLIDLGISGAGDVIKYSTGVASNAINAGVSLAKGSSLKEAVNGFVENTDSLTTSLENSVQTNIDNTLKSNGYSEEDVANSKIGEYTKQAASIIEDVAGSSAGVFVKYAIKTAVSNPASLSNPTYFLAKTTASALSDKSVRNSITTAVSKQLNTTLAESDSETLNKAANVFGDVAPYLLDFIGSMGV